MIKELFSLALLALMTTSACAQEYDTKTNEWAQKDHVKLSINAGPQWNNGGFGVKAGVNVHIPFGQSRWGFEPGLYWSFRNVKNEETSNVTKGETHYRNKKGFKDKLHYLEIPLCVAVQVARHEDKPFCMSVFWGPYLAYGFSGTSHYTKTKDGQTTTSEVNAFSNEGHLKSRFDYGVNLGAYAVIKQHLKVRLFTEIGCKDIYKPISDIDDFFGDLFFGINKINVGAGITIGYQF